MGSSHRRPAPRAASTPTAGARPRSSRACLGLRRRDLRRAVWLALAVTGALALDLMVSLNLHAAGITLSDETGQLKIDTSRQASADSKSLSAFGPRSEKFGIKPYVAYGLTDRLTLGLGSETQFVRSGLETERAMRIDGWMNTELFLRGRLRDQDWYVVSVQDIVRLPGQDVAPGQADSSLRLQYGRSGKIGGGTWTSAVKSAFHPLLSGRISSIGEPEGELQGFDVWLWRWFEHFADGFPVHEVGANLTREGVEKGDSGVRLVSEA